MSFSSNVAMVPKGGIRSVQVPVPDARAHDVEVPCSLGLRGSRRTAARTFLT